MAHLARIELGDGPAVLMLHGLSGAKEAWGDLSSALAGAGARAVAVDLPGWGASPAPAGYRHRPRDHAARLAELVHELAPVALVGHSLGAQLALLLALELPWAIPRLALIAPIARPDRAPPFPPRTLRQLILTPWVGPLLARAAIRLGRRSRSRRERAMLLAVAEPGRVNSDPAARSELDAATARLRHVDARALVAWAAAGLRLDLRPRASQVRQPVLVLVGARDRVAAPRAGQELAALLPRGRLVRLAGAGHLPHLERPSDALPALVEHLLAGRGIMRA